MESVESEDRIMMSCPNDEQFGFMVGVGFDWVSSEVSTRSMIVVSFEAGGCGMLAIACSTISFFTVASACALRMLRSGGVFAIVETVLIEDLVIMKFAAEEDAAMIKGFECPGEYSRKIRVVFLRCSSLRLTGLWLMLKVLLCLRAAIFAFVSFVLAVFLAADNVALFRIDVCFPFPSLGIFSLSVS